MDPVATPEVEAVAEVTPEITPTPEVTPEVTDVPAAEEASIAEYNKALEAQLNEEPIPAPDEALPAETDEVEADEDATEGESAAEVSEASEFTLDADASFEEFAEAKAAYLETVEITPELQAILDRQDAELTAAREVVAEFDGIANKDTLAKVGSAINRLYENADIDEATGRLKVNAKPFVELLRSDFTDELRPIAEELFSSDSQKYEGVSLIEEILVDQFGADKANKMIAFGFTDQPLPVVPTVALPAGFDERNREAYFRQPEAKRFQIEGLVSDIVELQNDAADASEWRRDEIQRDINSKWELLQAEYNNIADVQKRLDGDRQHQETAARQATENAQRLHSQVAETYNGEMFALVDDFAATLAPQLTFADTDTQLSQARNIMARVQNALSFNANDPKLADDPLAEHFAKQLKEEGVKFDFAKGRDLLRSHLKATEKLVRLQNARASQNAIEAATKEKNRIMANVKVEQKQLLGQLSTKYVKSNGNALKKTVDALAAKKQAVRSITPNGSAFTREKARPVQDDIAEYNRKIAAATGDELFSSYQN